MRYQAKKVWSDLRAGGGRTALMIFALVLGVWGLGSVIVSARILGPDLKQNFQGTAPAHAILSWDHPGSLDPAALGPGVEAEYRDLALLRIEVRPDEWIPLWLFAVGDFERQTVTMVTPWSGAPVPPPGTMVIERDGLLVSNLNTGSTARVRSGDRQFEVTVSGIAFDPAQAPATQDHFIYAYTDPDTWAEVTDRQPGERLLVRFPNAGTKAEVEAAVARLDLPPDTKVAVPEFETHPHQWQLDLLMGIIGSVGFLAFLLSAVMVGQTTSALMARQVRQIGILKAIGASRLRIMVLSSAYLLVLAAAAGVVSVPLAGATGQAFAAFVAKILNFEVLTTDVPAETFGLLIVGALALPFMFATPTLVRAGGVTVREALSPAPPVAGASGTTRGWWAVRNLLRRPVRTLLVVATTGLGVALFATGFNVRESLAQFLGSTSDAMRFDLQVVLSESVDRSALEAPFAGLPFARTEIWTGGRGELQSRVAGVARAEASEAGVGVVALPWDTTMAVPRLTAGRWLNSAEAPEVLLNQASVTAFGQPRTGDSLSLSLGGVARTVTVVGIIEEIDRAKVYLSDTLWTRWADPGRRGNTLTIVAQDRSYAGVMALKKQVEQAVAASDLKVLYVISQAERTKIIADHLDIILTVLLLLAFLVLWVATLGTAAAASITVLERTREIGVLRAIGAGPRRIIGMFVAEGLLSSLAGLAVGLAAAWPISLAASGFFGTLMLGEGAVLRFAWNPAGVAVTVGVTLVFGVVSAWGPSRAASRVTTRRALAYE